MNVYKTRIPETGDFRKALQRLQWYTSIIFLTLTQQKAKTYRHRMVVEDTNMKKNL
jgi:fatty acid-binding protein DegV